MGPLVGPESPEEEGTQDAGTPAVGPGNPAAVSAASLQVLHSRAPKGMKFMLTPATPPCGNAG